MFVVISITVWYCDNLFCISMKCWYNSWVMGHLKCREGRCLLLMQKISALVKLIYNLHFRSSTLRIQHAFNPIQSWPELLFLGNYFPVNTSLNRMKHSWFQQQLGPTRPVQQWYLNWIFCCSLRITCWDLFQIFCIFLDLPIDFLGLIFIMNIFLLHFPLNTSRQMKNFQKNEKNKQNTKPFY